MVAGEEYSITVNAKEAGQGHVNCRITSTSTRVERHEETRTEKTDKGTKIIKTITTKTTTQSKTKQGGDGTKEQDVEVNVVDNGDGTYTIKYKVKQKGDYDMALRFGGQLIPDGAQQITVSESGQGTAVISSSSTSSSTSTVTSSSATATGAAMSSSTTSSSSTTTSASASAVRKSSKTK